MQQGGYTLYIRHVSTDWSQYDNVQILHHGDWESCNPNQIRQLSKAGRKDARTIGKAIKALNIKISAIYASPYCRTVETASLMELGVDIQKTYDIMNMRAVDYVGGREHVIKTAQKRISIPPIKPGTNTLLSAHGNVAREATSVYPQEGEVLVFKPLGNSKFEFMGRIPVEKWDVLVKLDKQ